MANVYKRGRIWWVRFQINGAEIRQSAHTTSKAKASRFLGDLQEEHGRLARGGRPKRSFDEAMARFINEYMPGLKPSSAYRYMGSIRALEKHFGGAELGAIGKGMLAEYVSSRKGKVSDTTIRRDIACLGSMLTCAVEWDWLEANPVKSFGKRSLKESPHRTRFLTDVEYKKLLESAGDLRPIIIVAVETGLRLGEILNLRRQDVDLERAELHVREGKTGQRTVPMSKAASAQMSAQPRHMISPLVFWHGEGKALRVDAISSKFAALVKKAGIKDFRFHDLRHTFATWAIQKRGLDLYRVQKILGHKGSQMTQRYAHLQTDDLRGAGTKTGTPPRDFSK